MPKISGTFHLSKIANDDCSLSSGDTFPCSVIRKDQVVCFGLECGNTSGRFRFAFLRRSLCCASSGCLGPALAVSMIGYVNSDVVVELCHIASEVCEDGTIE